MSYAVYPYRLGCISLPLPFHSLFGGIHRSCNILQQVQEDGIEFVKGRYSEWYVLVAILSQNTCDREFSWSFGFPFSNSTRPCFPATMMSFGVEFAALNTSACVYWTSEK